ncbi:MAG: lysophospholipid acyltransferase family protein [Actinobacteria bacterium]|nr:lysophospholipid acyltransferase family protein [Actinomycetota bacterium]
MGYKFLELLVFIIPYPVCYLIALIVAKVVVVGNINVDVLKTNVSKVLDMDKNDKEVKKIVTKIYINWFYNVVDFLKHPLISKEKLKRRVELVGTENLENALKKGKGAVLFTAHIGNFEWGACRIAVEGFNICGTGLSRLNKHTNNFFESRRLSKGLKTLYVNNLLHIFKLLKNNEVIAIPTDWDSQGTAKLYDFFGKKAYIPSGPIEIAMKSGAPLLPSFIYRKDKYTHFQIIEKQLELDFDSSYDKKELIAINTRKMTVVLEKYIKEHLDQWEMFHNIWA